MKKIFRFSCIIIFSFFVNNFAHAAGPVIFSYNAKDYVEYCVDNGYSLGDYTKLVKYDSFIDTINQLRTEIGGLQNQINNLNKTVENYHTITSNVKNNVEAVDDLKRAVITNFKICKDGDTSLGFNGDAALGSKCKTLSDGISNLEKNILESIKNIPTELKPSTEINEVISDMVKAEVAKMKEEILKELKK